MPKDQFRDRLHAHKDTLLNSMRRVLAEAGLDNYDIDHIRLYVRKGPHLCPEGTEPVWEPTLKPDGTIVYEWVCK